MWFFSFQGGAEHNIPVVVSKISKEQRGKLFRGCPTVASWVSHSSEEQGCSSEPGDCTKSLSPVPMTRPHVAGSNYGVSDPYPHPAPCGGAGWSLKETWNWFYCQWIDCPDLDIFIDTLNLGTWEHLVLPNCKIWNDGIKWKCLSMCFSTWAESYDYFWKFPLLVDLLRCCPYRPFYFFL